MTKLNELKRAIEEALGKENSNIVLSHYRFRDPWTFVEIKFRPNSACYAYDFSKRMPRDEPDAGMGFKVAFGKAAKCLARKMIERGYGVEDLYSREWSEDDAVECYDFYGDEIAKVHGEDFITPALKRWSDEKEQYKPKFRPGKKTVVAFEDLGQSSYYVWADLEYETVAEIPGIARCYPTDEQNKCTILLDPRYSEKEVLRAIENLAKAKEERVLLDRVAW